jgi:hypothetical protein
LGDRFYQQQLKALGTCPGYNGKKKSMAWDDAKKAKAISMYQDADPTAENSVEIVKNIADELEESPNGVRMILIKAEVYVKKTPATGAKKTATASADGKTPRVSKEAAQARLATAIESFGATVDDEIISKLTGKAAAYIAGILESK